MTPWNYPLLMAAWKIAPILAAGNTLVIKPSEQTALTRANATPYALAASVWTADARRSHAIASRLDAGTVWVNAHLVLASEVPWGGFKGSGYGRDLSSYALDDYSRTKHVMHSMADCATESAWRI